MKINKFSLLLIAVLLLVISFSIQAVSQDKTITLTLADTTGQIGLRGEGVNIFVEEVEKHTNGRVKIEVYWGESLLKGKEILNGIKQGIVDMGYINPNYYPNELTVNGFFPVFPQGPEKFSDMYEIYTTCFEEIPEFIQEFESQNQKPLYINTVLPMTVASTKKFTSFEDFKGKKIRAASKWYLKQLEGAGADPISIPFGDVYMALQTGTLDANYTNLDGIHRTKQDEVAQNIFTMRDIWVATPYSYTINIDKFNSLPSDIQEQLIEAGRVASLRFSELFDAEWELIIEEQIEAGYIVTEATPQDIEKWMTMPVIAQLKQEWVEEAKGFGVENPEEILNRTQEIIDSVID